MKPIVKFIGALVALLGLFMLMQTAQKLYIELPAAA